MIRRFIMLDAIILACAVLVACLTGLISLVPSIIWGGLIGFVNIFAITLLIGRLLKLKKPVHGAVVTLGLIGKFILLAAVFYYLIVYCRLNVLGLLAGYSCALVSIAFAGFFPTPGPDDIRKEK